ncbi:unnamed protein product [Caenorhabditis angaria]|uniref:Mediator of RNA polymerase II transcription subunit 22 n=1 Tax=Caenorhabditis angaria TaxID=860376 RepID=A0A9P1IHX3_9PELO|nr:unnamed protein product [Caenorhabditis angaria]
MSGVAGGANKKSASRSVATKKLIIQEFKRRLRDNIRSLNDNFYHILNAAKVNLDDAAYKNVTGKMSEFYTTKNEMVVRAQLMVRAADELQKLTSDLKEFLILHDFHFLTYSINQAERQCEDNQRAQLMHHGGLDMDVSNIAFELDRELENMFYFRH